MGDIAWARGAKRIIGMLHLPALPGSPRCTRSLEDIEAAVLADARVLHTARFDACVIENFGDAPFHKDTLEPITIAAMTRLAVAVRRAFPDLVLGINALRNDAAAALAIATASGARFVRVNVHVGVTATDQGLVEGRAAQTLRLRDAWRSDVHIWADVHVKHGSSLSHADIAAEAEDAVRRGLADAVVVSGRATGDPTAIADVRRVRDLGLGVPVLVGSGSTADNVAEYLQCADGVIAGTWLKQQGRVENPVDAERARRFAAAAEAVRATAPGRG